MSNESQLPIYKQSDQPGTDYRYYLRGSLSSEGDTEISEQQYNELTEFGATRSSRSLTASDILRLHQEQDPASEFYKGKPVEDEPVKEEQGTGSYYDVTNENINSAQVIGEDKPTDSFHSTESVTKTPTAEDFDKDESGTVSGTDTEEANKPTE